MCGNALTWLEADRFPERLLGLLNLPRLLLQHRQIAMEMRVCRLRLDRTLKKVKTLFRTTRSHPDSQQTLNSRFVGRLITSNLFQQLLGFSDASGTLMGGRPLDQF